jgi:hypothetical protein
MYSIFSFIYWNSFFVFVAVGYSFNCSLFVIVIVAIELICYVLHIVSFISGFTVLILVDDTFNFDSDSISDLISLSVLIPVLILFSDSFHPSPDSKPTFFLPSSSLRLVVSLVHLVSRVKFMANNSIPFFIGIIVLSKTILL